MYILYRSKQGSLFATMDVWTIELMAFQYLGPLRSAGANSKMDVLPTDFQKSNQNLIRIPVMSRNAIE